MCFQFAAPCLVNTCHFLSPDLNVSHKPAVAAMHVTAVRAGACCKGPLAGSGGPFASPEIPRRVLSDCNGSNALHAGAWLLHDMQLVEALLRRSAGGQQRPRPSMLAAVSRWSLPKDSSLQEGWLLRS